jgi:hypothetical protein
VEENAMARLSRDFPPGPLAATATTAPRRLPTFERPGMRCAALAIAVTLAVAIAHLAADDTASARAGAADPELARLLRVMAFTKAAMAAAAVWLVDRLLRRPLGSVLAACLAATAALMAAAPVLMWHVAHVGTGALLFHAAARPAARAGLVPTEAWLSERSRERSH